MLGRRKETDTMKRNFAITHAAAKAPQHRCWMLSVVGIVMEPPC